MPRDANDWNFDRITSAHFLINDVQSDMMRCLHKGAANDFVRDRMVQRLKMAAENISKLKLDHEDTP